MRPQLRHLLPAIGLILVPGFSLAAEVESPTAQETTARQAVEGTDAPVLAPDEGTAAAQVDPGSEQNAATSTDEPGTAPATTRDQEDATGTGKPTGTSSVTAAPETPPTADTMPHHAPLRRDVAEGLERRRRVPLVIFKDSWGMARFTESDPAIHEKARSIAARATTSFWVNLSTSVAGFGLLGAAMVTPTCETRSEGPRCHPNIGLIMSGVGVGLIGSLVATFIAPKEKDFEELADAWNATVDEPIVPEPGLDPAGTDVPVPEAASP